MRLTGGLKYLYMAAGLLLLVSCEDTGRGSVTAIDRLNARAFDLRYKDIAASQAAARQVLSAVESGDPGNYDAMAMAWNSLAYAFFLTSEFDSTKIYLEKVRAIPADYNNRAVEEAITHITEARLYLRECRYAEAFIIYDSTLTIFRGGMNRLKYNDILPLKKYDHSRYDWARSDYMLGRAVLGYYYRDTEMPVILKSLDKIRKDTRLHTDTTQLSILYYTYAGTYEKAIPADISNFYLALENIRKGLDLLVDPASRNDYYLANFYQITAQVILRTKRYWAADESFEKARWHIDDFKREYLAGKYGWDREDVESDELPLLLLERADEIFTRYDDPYQKMASALHIGNYKMRRGDSVSAWAHFRKAITYDSVISGRGGYARIWKKYLYETLLNNMPENTPAEQVRNWFNIYTEESAVIAESTKRDYDAQRGKAEAEAKAKKTQVWIFLILSVCIPALALLYFLNRQNKKLKKARAELKGQNEQLDAQYRELHFMQRKLIEQKRMELLTYVVRGISHELSQPLGSITQTLYDTVKDTERLAANKDALTGEEYRRLVDNIRSDLATISRSKDTISDLITSFRNTIRENVVDPQSEFNLCRKLEDIATVVRPTIKSNIDLIVECPPGLVIRSFPLLLSQVVTNLISNANQHAFADPDDEGNRILIKCEAQAKDLILRCIDNGVGIPEGELDKLCQPFVSKKQANLGLGLSLVKNIVEQYMNGEINFVSDRGLTVTVHIPDCITGQG